MTLSLQSNAMPTAWRSLSLGIAFCAALGWSFSMAAEEPPCHQTESADAPAVDSSHHGMAVGAASSAPSASDTKGQASSDHRDHTDHAGHVAPSQKASEEPSTPRHLQIPDLELVDQDGKPVQFYTDLIADRQVIVNFVFTTCTTICPPMGASFGRLQDLLGDRFGDDVFLISVSVDPVVDTPERLKAWSEKFGRREGWTLVTGDRDDVNQVLRALGAFTGDKIDHAPLALVGNDAQGMWQRVYGLAPPQTMVTTLEGLANHGLTADEIVAENNLVSAQEGR